MQKLSADEIWRQIPPEEKFDLLAKTHSQGFIACASVVLLACTIAVGLKLPWLIWTSLLASPFLFQIITNRSWRELRPKIILRYLAARSVARRFAFALNAEDLGMKVIMRGEMERLINDDNKNVEIALQAVEAANKKTEVWLALLNSAVVAFSEGVIGGELEFISLIEESLQVQSSAGESSGGEYRSDHELILTTKAGTDNERRYRFSSKHPAALIVLEKQLLALRERAIFVQREREKLLAEV